MTKESVLLFLCLLFLFQGFSCSNTSGTNTAAATNNSETEGVAENDSMRSNSNHSAGNVESSPGSNPNDIVLFDGKNYIKKSGWKVPSLDDTYVGDNQWNDKPQENTTENGRKVKTVGRQFVYKTPREYSENFRLESDDLNYIKGPLLCYGFFKNTANGRVFEYTVDLQRVQPANVSNSNRESANGYLIQDRDGDGVFETLLGPHDDYVVPNWVLKEK